MVSFCLRLKLCIKEHFTQLTSIDPCQEPVFLAEHGGSVEECQKQYEMILHQFELENEAERKAR